MNENTLHGRLTARGNLIGTVNTIVYAHNYNDLSNKPSINSVTLQGNKTASDLGLATPSDILVTSVNEQTGDVELTGDNIPYDTLTSVNAKINDLESQIVGAGVQSVNGMTGNVTLTGANINYSVGVSLNSRIDAVEGEIPVINYPVTSVNSKTGAVVLAGSDIEYSAGVSLNDQIDNVSGEISDLTGADIPLTSEDSTKVSTAIGDLSDLTTTVKSSIVGAVNEVNGNKANKSQMFKLKTCETFTKTIAGNGFAQILGSDLALTESGYSPIAVTGIYSNQANVCIVAFDGRINSGSGQFALIRNVSSSSVTATMNVTILFARNDIL